MATVSYFKPIVDKVPALAAAYRNWRDQRAANLIPSVTPMGYRFAGNPQMAEGTFEPDETKLIQKLLSNVDLFINIGANIGYYCCQALSRGIHTIAFEPIATNLQSLCQNIAANDWQDNVELFPLALADSPGILKIYGSGTGASLIPGWAGTPLHQVRLIPTSTLDIIVAHRIPGRRCLILVDVEGAENSVLRGAEAVLSMTPRPIWVVEISVAEAHVKTAGDFLQTFDLFFRHGYEAWTADKSPRLIERPEVYAIHDGGKNTIDTHNFIFR